VKEEDQRLYWLAARELAMLERRERARYLLEVRRWRRMLAAGSGDQGEERGEDSGQEREITQRE
jgi:hypothetical protein